jgi:hypothetical protein
MQARHALLFTGLLWLSSCASTNPALLGEGGVRLDRLPERPYRVALLPIADVGALRSAETSGLRFELGEAQLPMKCSGGLSRSSYASSLASTVSRRTRI